MSHLFQNTVKRASALLAIVALSSCGGGGGEPDAQPVAQTISFAAPANQTFGVAPLTLVATASSGLSVSLASTTPAVCTISGARLTVVGAGSCSVTASQAGNAAFTAATPVSNTFTVAQAAQTITFVSPGSQTLGTVPAALMATATSNLVVSFASSTPAVCTVSGTVLTLVSAGTCTLAANQAGNTNYLAATAVSHSFSVAVGLLSQTINFAAPGSQTLGIAPAPLAATATSGLAVSFASLTPAVCTVSGSALTLLGAGTCTASASQAGDTVYAAAAAVMRSFTVAPAAQIITFNAVSNQTLGTAVPSLVASSSAGLPVTLTSTTAGVCTVSGTMVTLVAVGTCSVDATQAGNANVAPAATVTRSFSVVAPTPVAQTISFVSPGNQTLGTTPPALFAAASSGLTVTFASTTPSTCSVSGTALRLLAAGTCIVDASQAGNSTYAAAPTVSRVFTIAPAPLTVQTITFTSPGNQTLGTTPAPLSASASSGLAVTLASTTPSTCTVTGTTLNLLAAGTCIVDASQGGDSTYAAAPTVSRVITIAPAALTAQSITFSAPTTQVITGHTALPETAPAALTASASSGLTVSFASTTTGVCTVNGTALQLLTEGSCSITASQGGNGSFAAATPVSRTFTVAKQLLANAGFESTPTLYVAGTQPGAGQPVGAGYWLTNVANPVTRSNDARTGLFSASLTCPALCASNLYGNSSDNGGLTLPAGSIGTSPTLTFWIKGEPGTTGNINYSLRYLNASGAILGQSAIVTNTNTYANWTQISLSAGAIPVGTTAVFFEANYALGPVGVQPSGLVFTSGGYKIDDILLSP